MHWFRVHPSNPPLLYHGRPVIPIEERAPGNEREKHVNRDKQSSFFERVSEITEHRVKAGRR